MTLTHHRIIDSQRGSEGEELSVYVIRRYSVAYKSVKRVLSVGMKNCCILQLIIGGKLVWPINTVLLQQVKFGEQHTFPNSLIYVWDL